MNFEVTPGGPILRLVHADTTIAPVPKTYYRRWTIDGPRGALISSVALRARKTSDLADLVTEGHVLSGGMTTWLTPDTAVVLDEVWTTRRARGQGLAGTLLQLALREASRHHWTVLCRPHAHDGGDRKKLMRFYRSHGFKGDGPWLVRH